MTNQVNNQRHKYHPLTVHYHNDSEDDDRCQSLSVLFRTTLTRTITTRTTDTPGFKPFIMFVNLNTERALSEGRGSLVNLIIFKAFHWLKNDEVVSNVISLAVAAASPAKSDFMLLCDNPFQLLPS